jgi:hypothetical protein
MPEPDDILTCTASLMAKNPLASFTRGHIQVEICVQV